MKLFHHEKQQLAHAKNVTRGLVWIVARRRASQVFWLLVGWRACWMTSFEWGRSRPAPSLEDTGSKRLVVGFRQSLTSSHLRHVHTYCAVHIVCDGCLTVFGQVSSPIAHVHTHYAVHVHTNVFLWQECGVVSSHLGHVHISTLHFCSTF